MRTQPASSLLPSNTAPFIDAYKYALGVGPNFSSTLSFTHFIRDLPCLCKTYTHLTPSMNTQNKVDGPAASPTKRCTPFERRLISCVVFLFTVLLHALSPIFLWPHVSCSPYHGFIVTTTRILIAALAVVLDQYLTGEWSMNSFFYQTALGILGIFLAHSATG